MKPVRVIPPTDWMRDKSVHRVMRALGDGTALFVGGCVRDALMGRTGGDVDIATLLTPDRVQETLRAAAIKSIPTGIEHGTVTAVANDKAFEITTLRRDVATDGRRAVVAFTKDWAEDAARRDFTINALYADEKGNIFDPLGQGVADLDARRLRFVGDAKARIAEDYLRILRYFRFAAQFGWTLNDAGELDACRAAADKIATLSKERVTHEILKLLAANNPALIIQQMQDNHILPALLAGVEPEAIARAGHPWTRLAFLRDVEKYLALSNEQKRHVRAVRDGAANFAGEEAQTIKRLIYFEGNDMAREIYRYWCAAQKKEPQAALLDILSHWQAPIFPVTGEDLIAQGYQPGPELGAELKRQEQEWLKKI